jgi:diguanylate cyclase (GGDEF)-like protein
MTKFTSELNDEVLHFLAEALTESGQAVSIYDSEDRLRYANETYCGIFLQGFEGPFTFTEILRHGAKCGVGVRSDDGDVEALIARTLPRRRSAPRKAFEADFMDGRWFWMDHTVLPNGWVLTVAADITALKHNEKTLRQAHEAALLASRTDALTSLPNRRYIMERLDEALATSQSSGSNLCVAVIDIDRFKSINDTHGHDAGDAVLLHFSHMCRERLRPQDQIGRIGGEEFLLIVRDVRLSEAVCLIEHFREEFPPAKLRGIRDDLPYTFSAGVTETLPYDDRTSVLYRADRALYSAKNAGRNRVEVGFEGR